MGKLGVPSCFIRLWVRVRVFLPSEPIWVCRKGPSVQFGLSIEKIQAVVLYSRPNCIDRWDQAKEHLRGI